MLLLVDEINEGVFIHYTIEVIWIKLDLDVNLFIEYTSEQRRKEAIGRDVLPVWVHALLVGSPNPRSSSRANRHLLCPL